MNEVLAALIRGTPLLITGLAVALAFRAGIWSIGAEGQFYAGAVAAALVFGAASARQFAFQAAGLEVPYQFFLMAPYGLTLLALAGVGGRARAAAALGKNYSVMSDG